MLFFKKKWKSKIENIHLLVVRKTVPVVFVFSKRRSNETKNYQGIFLKKKISYRKSMKIMIWNEYEIKRNNRNRKIQNLKQHQRTIET